MWQQFLNPLHFQPRDIELLVDLSEGFSGSDVREVCLRLNRRRIAAQRSPGLKDAFQVLQNLAIGEGPERRFLTQLRDKDERAITTMLRDRNVRLYSLSAVADLLGVSKATAFRRAKGATQSA